MGGDFARVLLEVPIIPAFLGLSLCGYGFYDLILGKGNVWPNYFAGGLSLLATALVGKAFNLAKPKQEGFKHIDLSFSNLNIVLDAMGVIFQAGDDVADLLIPFLRSKSCPYTDSEIREQYIKCSLGEFSSEVFWVKMGVKENAGKVEQEYLAGHKLTQGLLDFLVLTKHRGLDISIISNDVSEWSAKLHERFSLKAWITHRCISGDVKKRKPEASIFEAFIEKSGYKPEDCIFIDDRLQNLDAAKRIGFITILYKSDSRAMDNSEHDVVETFSELSEVILHYCMKRKSKAGFSVSQ